MKKTAATLIAALGLASAANAGLTLDDLSIATITGGSVTFGDTSGSSNDLSGDTFGLGSWSGGDDVYTLVWGGGDLVVDLLFSDIAGDLDLFLFDNNLSGGPGELAQSLSVSDNEQVEVLGAAAGTYYISVDGWLGASNSYELRVNGIPAPSALAMLGLGGLVAGRRRR